MQRRGVEFTPIVTDDLRAVDIEDVDAPPGMQGKHVRGDRQQLLRMPVRPLRDASTRTDIPVSIAVLVHGQHQIVICWGRRHVGYGAG